MSGLLEVPFDIKLNAFVPLSEIAEEITAIELEMTDESLLNPDYIKNIFISEKEVFIASPYKIHVFNKKGKFIRTIGSRGQGPGEYGHIGSIAMDEKNKRLFILSGKIICYDFNGKFLKEKRLFLGDISSMNYINNELLLIEENIHSDDKSVYSKATLYRLNDDLYIIDSCKIRDTFFETSDGYMFRYGSGKNILQGAESIYIYYGNNFEMMDMGENVLCDTMYRFDKSHLIPYLKLKLKDDGQRKDIDLCNFYRSSRYIFSYYRNRQDKRFYYYCYDTKAEKTYNMQDGYIDDINQIKEPVRIQPFNLDTEMFYYLHTKMKPDDKEEPNPTLYIGKLKTKN